jgi:integrase
MAALLRHVFFFTGRKLARSSEDAASLSELVIAPGDADAYLTVLRAGAAGERNKGTPLLGTLRGCGRKQLTSARMVRRMIVRWAVVAGFTTKLGRHTFRTTRITVSALDNGPLEYAQQMAAYENARTTKLYDRWNDQVTLNQVERTILSG